jgi:hypothetical protein
MKYSYLETRSHCVNMSFIIERKTFFQVSSESILKSEIVRLKEKAENLGPML